MAYIRPNIGEIKEFAGTTIPGGFLSCDGSAIDRTTYANLYAVIGDTWGAGDGTTTFNIPDLRGASPAGVGTSVGYIENETIALATKIDDQVQGHIHDVGIPYVPGSTFGSFNVPNSPADYLSANNGFYISNPVADGTNGTPRTGLVTKGKTVGVNFIIRYA